MGVGLEFVDSAAVEDAATLFCSAARVGRETPG
jgi:hypothetical protein